MHCKVTISGKKRILTVSGILSPITGISRTASVNCSTGTLTSVLLSEKLILLIDLSPSTLVSVSLS